MCWLYQRSAFFLNSTVPYLKVQEMDQPENNRVSGMIMSGTSDDFNHKGLYRHDMENNMWHPSEVFSLPDCWPMLCSPNQPKTNA